MASPLLNQIVKASGIERIDPSRISVLPTRILTPPAGSGGQGYLENQPLPMDWATAMYAPGWPIRPSAKPAEEGIPREIDYPIAANVSIAPRVHYGLMPFGAIADAFENVVEIKMCVHLLTREMNSFAPRLVDSEDNEITDHPYHYLCDSPDGGATPFAVWQTRFLQNSLIFDAGANYLIRDHGVFKGLSYVDGSTLFLLVDDHGRPPAPPAPFITQVIKGTPFGWYTQDDLWYRPRFRRYNAPYGMPFIEMGWAWVLIIANVTGFELAHYREGNMPEGWLEAPESWNSLEQIALYETTLNSRMSTGPTERNRIRVTPFGFKYTSTKKPDFPVVLYERARDNLGLCAGIPPSEFGKVPGSGLGGKGFDNLTMNQLFRMGLLPCKTYIESAFNDIFRRIGIDDVRMDLQVPSDSIDPSKQNDITVGQFSNGMITFNEARSDVGKEPIGDAGDVYFLIKGSQIIMLDNQLHATILAGGQKQAAAGLPPDSMPDPSTKQTAMKLLNTGELPQTFHSIPGRTNGHDHTETAESVGTGGGAFMPSQGGSPASSPASSGIPTDKLMEIVNNALGKAIRKIDTLEAKVADLSRIEKHCGVCPEDDAYFGSPVVHAASIDFPDEVHANDVEIVAMRPDDGSLPPKAGLWKPYGGEQENLISYIGHPQFVAEEATYLADRAMEFYLVPVAFTAKVGDEEGAVVYYTGGASPSHSVSGYDPVWVERAAVLDYIVGQVDRHSKNWLTHPDDDRRPVLIDNGLTFPVTNLFIQSQFVAAMSGKKLSSAVLDRIDLLRNDPGAWADIEELVGSTATNLARARAFKLASDQRIPYGDPTDEQPNAEPSNMSSMPVDSVAKFAPIRKDGGGNPYHDETGKFTDAAGASEGGDRATEQTHEAGVKSSEPHPSKEPTPSQPKEAKSETQAKVEALRQKVFGPEGEAGQQAKQEAFKEQVAATEGRSLPTEEEAAHAQDVGFAQQQEEQAQSTGQAVAEALQRAGIGAAATTAGKEAVKEGTQEAAAAVEGKPAPATPDQTDEEGPGQFEQDFPEDSADTPAGGGEQPSLGGFRGIGSTARGGDQGQGAARGGGGGGGAAGGTGGKGVGGKKAAAPKKPAAKPKGGGAGAKGKAAAGKAAATAAAQRQRVEQQAKQQAVRVEQANLRVEQQRAKVEALRANPQASEEQKALANAQLAILQDQANVAAGALDQLQAKLKG